ncbi:thioredoxin-dependent thiol peroxidase [Thermoactinomyces mirandus]|uniref:thioredoxin-dependent peroxiredoxin n=1 Tax=Thermoactinomyces mirandus TaxID=2756294 RepID=A0A7W1XPX9_9BACL|nr:thioredoxin-dependent thiol peroxidase [Thermoactinomyces mirandus]MBA4601113.1 thioredoxin-dependent thiol peroxidase [Thermoactinomyces mirandus]
MVKEGDQAIDFTLEASNGNKVTLSELKGQNVVLFFYPKDQTPGCTKEACGFRDAYREFEELDTVILGINKDSVASHQKFIEKQELPFLLLSDPDGEICEKYGVIKEKNMFGKKRLGIERSTFVIDKDGKIAKVYRKVKVTGHVEEVLQFVKDYLQ